MGPARLPRLEHRCPSGPRELHTCARKAFPLANDARNPLSQLPPFASPPADDQVLSTSPPQPFVWLTTQSNSSPPSLVMVLNSAVPPCSVHCSLYSKILSSSLTIALSRE